MHALATAEKEVERLKQREAAKTVRASSQRPSEARAPESWADPCNPLHLKLNPPEHPSDDQKRAIARLAELNPRWAEGHAAYLERAGLLNDLSPRLGGRGLVLPR